MKDIKEIIVYTNGDSNDITTWSNVPYFFTKELEKRNIKVDRVNINYNYKSSVTAFVYFYLIKVIRTFITLIKGSKPKLKFQYTNYYKRQIEKIMNESMKKYSNADLQLIFSLSYSLNNNLKPLVMFGDWTIEYRLKNRQKREPSAYEKKLIKEQYETLNKASAIVTIMPNSKVLMEKNSNKKVFYFGTGINSMINYSANTAKYDSNLILFSGRKKEYFDGLIRLIKVVNYCNDSFNRDYKINVIGMNREDVTNIDTKNCSFHGYLRKDDEKQCKEYYKLINNSKLLVNINNGWNGISTLLEVLYHGTPIMISRNNEVESVIGLDNEYCEYIDDDEDIISIAKKLDDYMMMNRETYNEICKKAHESVKGQEWSTIVDRFLNEMKGLL